MIRKFFITLLLGVASVAGLSQFLWAPVVEYYERPTGAESHSLLGLIFELLQPVNEIYPFVGGGYLFIVTILIVVLWLYGAARALFNYFDRSSRGLSVLETRLSIDVQDAEGIEARSTRQQRFHANEPNISASKLTHIADAEGGEVVKDSIKIRSWLGPKEFTREVLPRGSGRKMVVTEQYESTMPINWFVIYLPNAVVYYLNRHFGMFQSAVVRRSSEVVYRNEFAAKDCVVSLVAIDRPITNTEILVSFHPEYWKKVSDMKAYRVRETALEHIQIEELQGHSHPTYRVRANSLRESTLEMHWRFNAPLEPCERCPFRRCEHCGRERNLQEDSVAPDDDNAPTPKVHRPKSTKK